MDNLDFYQKHESEAYEKEKKLPVCDLCSEPIYGDSFEFEEFTLCEDCMDSELQEIKENSRREIL